MANSRIDEFLPLERAYRLLALLLRRWYVPAGIAGVTAILTFLTLSGKPPTYEARALLVVSSPLERRGERQDDITAMMPQSLTVQDYAIVAQSPPVLLRLREKADWKSEDGTPVELEAIQKSVFVSTSVIERTNISIVHSPTLQLNVKASDPNKAADLANQWADLTVEMSKVYSVSSVEGLREFLSDEFESVRLEYDTRIEQATEQFGTGRERMAQAIREKNTAVANLVSNQLQEIRDLKDSHANARLDLEIELGIDALDQEKLRLIETLETLAIKKDLVSADAAGHRQQVASLEESVASLEPKFALRKGLSDTALSLLGEVSEERTVVGEEINPAYTDVAGLLETARSELAASEEKLKTLNTLIVSGEKRYRTADSELLTAQKRLDELIRRQDSEVEALETVQEAELESVTDEMQGRVEGLEKLVEWTEKKSDTELEGQAAVYTELGKKVLGAQLAEAESAPELRVLASAIGNAEPQPRGRVTAAMIAAFAAFCLAALLVLIVEGYLAFARPR